MTMRHKDRPPSVRGHCARRLKSVATPSSALLPNIFPSRWYTRSPLWRISPTMIPEPLRTILRRCAIVSNRTLKSRRLSPFDPHLFHEETKNNVSSGNNGGPVIARQLFPLESPTKPFAVASCVYPFENRVDRRKTFRKGFGRTLIVSLYIYI